MVAGPGEPLPSAPMDLAAPPAGTPPTPQPPPPGTPPAADPGRDRIVAGVAALLAGRLGVDPLWVRIGFVLLALAGGIGVLLYVGLWLALIVGRSGDRRWAQYVGGAIVVFGIPLVLNGGGFEFMSGQVAVVLLLVGLMLALWQPRARRRRVVPGPSTGSPRRPADSELPRQPRERRPPSVLGRATLGVAIAVAAVGALIDEANGGRLHPEQWLGAAAVVCGLGLLVGAVRGYARWLVVPAVAFAGVGYASGLTAELGIDASHLAGDEWVNISAATPGGLRHEHLAFGTLHIDITGAPDDPVTIDARVAIGTIRVATVEDVTVEVRADIDRGSVEVNGVDRDEPVIEVGPEGRPDVIVDARVGRGRSSSSATGACGLPSFPSLRSLRSSQIFRRIAQSTTSGR